MPSSTTPDGIVYPVVGDVMSPLNAWFAQQAASVQTALTALRAELATATTGTLVRIGKAAGSGPDQTGITTETEVTGTSVAFVLTAVTKINFQAYISTFSTSAQDIIVVSVRNNTTRLIDYTNAANSSGSLSGTSQTHSFSSEVELPAGSHRLNIAVIRALGSGSISVTKGATTPPTLIVNRIA